jgi:hypothetical protein
MVFTWEQSKFLDVMYSMLRNVAEKWTSHREGEAQQGDGHYQKESNASRNNKVSKLNFFHFLF